MKFRLVWFDSLGAKSSCVMVEAGGMRVLIDPGIAIMHPSYPASEEAKTRWYEEGFDEILRALEEADVVVITHYHYDHYLESSPEEFLGKVLLVKNPNEYINDSQRSRALEFFRGLYRSIGLKLEEVLEEPVEREYVDPFDKLTVAPRRSFGDYDERRREVLEAGKRWFKERARRWSKYRRVPEVDVERLKVYFADGGTFDFGGVRIKFTEPLFHGVEYSRTGWVIGLVVESGGRRLLYSSDVNGPIIEDYAEWIIEENPDVLILDGPMTYMLGYTLNLTNFRRCIANALAIVEGADFDLAIYDHHLPREARYRERTREVWERANKLGKRLTTAAEYLGMVPAVLRGE